MTSPDDPAGGSKETYSVGYEDSTLDFFGARRAATHAAFFLPHLRPGMALLDGGCGPGSLTADLARLVAPGEVVGVDVEPAQLTAAREHVAACGLTNVRFQPADLYALPFADASFDAAFLHGVIEHVRDPVAALREVYRVLKPGGVLGARHADMSGFLLEPTPPPLDRFAELHRRLMEHNGAHPAAGRLQPRWLREAGFARAALSASYDCWTRTPEDARRNARWLADLVGDGSFGDQIVAAGLADRETLRAMSQAFLDWGEHPDAFAAEAWGEAVA